MNGRKKNQTSSKKFRRRFLEFSPWFYHLPNAEWSHCWSCCGGSWALMGQGKAAGMCFPCHGLSSTAGTFKPLQRFILRLVLPELVCVPLPRAFVRGHIPPDSPFQLFLTTSKFKTCSYIHALSWIAAALS